MDPVLNPYSPGAGNTPRALIGRAADLRAFEIAVQRIASGRHPQRGHSQHGVRRLNI